MKAVVHDTYGDPGEVLEVRDIPTPVMGDTDVLVRVRAASAHPDVWHVVTGTPYLMRLMGSGIRRPKHKVPGSDLAGVVEAVGRRVTRLKPGDEVFGESVSFGWKNGGAFAEYASVPQELLALKPGNVTFEQAAAVPTSGYIALTNVRGAGALAGRSVLINGAGGCVGTLAIQIAKADGAHVTATDRTEKLPMMRALGADVVIDYAQQDILQSGERFDLILDVASTWWSDVCAHALTPTGTYLPVGHAQFGRATGRMGGRIVGSLPALALLMLRAMADPEKRKHFKMPTKAEAATTFRDLLASGRLTPIVARTFPLSEVRTAMRCIEDTTIPGRIILTP